MTTYTDLVHNCDACILDLFLQLQHRRGDIAGCDNVLLVSDSGFNDCCMECIRDQADDKIMFCNFSIKCFVVCNIEGNGASILDARGELLSTFEGSACYNFVRLGHSPNELRIMHTNGNLNASITEQDKSWSGDEA